MRAGKYNMVCEQGATFGRRIAIEYPSTASPDVWVPLDLSTYTARMQVRRTIDSQNVLVHLTTENGGLTINPGEENNEIYIRIEAGTTASISTNGFYDLEIVDDQNQVSRVLSGEFLLDPEVTR